MSVGDLALYLILAVFYVAMSLLYLPDTLPIGLKLALCSGGGLVGVTITWALYQIKPEATRYGVILISLLIAPVVRILAACWMDEPKRR